RQEVGDISIKPYVLAASRPESERAVRALPRQQARDRVLQPRLDLAVRRQPRLAGELVEIEHGHRLAGDLLRAAEGIAVERVEQARGVERGRERDRKRRAARAR